LKRRHRWTPKRDKACNRSPRRCATYTVFRTNFGFSYPGSMEWTFANFRLAKKLVQFQAMKESWKYAFQPNMRILKIRPKNISACATTRKMPAIGQHRFMAQ